MCKTGDGTAGPKGSETDTQQLFSSLKECINYVKENYPDANGATIQTDCTDSCKCFAEFGMVDWNTNSKYKSCMYEPGT